MKTIPIALAADYATRCTTLASALKVVRKDGTIYGFTSASEDSPPIGGVIYKANPGLDASQIVTASGTAVGNLEITTLHDESIFTTAEVMGGLWRNADFVIFRYNWAAISHGIDIQLAGTIGEISDLLNTLKAELRDLRQYLQQAVGSVTSKTCRYRYGSTDKNNGGLCMKDITGSPFTVTGTITGVTSNRIFRDSGRSEAADYFGEGMFIWLTGGNAGLSHKVRSYAADGTFTLALPTWLTVYAGDTYRAVMGCRKTLQACIDRGNVLNMGAEPHAPGLDSLTQSPVVNV